MEKLFLDGKTPVPLLTEKQAAELLNISHSKLKRIRYADEIEFYRIGNQISYSMEMIENFLRKCLRGGDC